MGGKVSLGPVYTVSPMANVLGLFKPITEERGGGGGEGGGNINWGKNLLKSNPGYPFVKYTYSRHIFLFLDKGCRN